MITFTNKSLFKIKAQAYVNTVNCVGVMGKGIALEFKRLYPCMFDTYRKLCKGKALNPGYTIRWPIGDGRFIFNTATKDHWKDKSKLAWVENCIITVQREMSILNLTSVAVPMMGCANGGLNWPDIKELMKYHWSEDSKVEYIVSEYQV